MSVSDGIPDPGHLSSAGRFTAVPKYLLEDSSLSFNALGILLWLLSQPDGREVDADQIPVDVKYGRAAILSGLKELQDAGYLTSGRAEA